MGTVWGLEVLMEKFAAIARGGYALLKRSPGNVALYIVLIFLTQALIPMALIPALLAKITNSVPIVQGAPQRSASNEGAAATSSNPYGNPADAKPHIVAPYLGWLFLGLALIPLLFWFRLAQNDLDNRMEFEMRKRIFANVLRQPPEFFRDYNPGQLANILTQVVTQAQQAFRSLCLEPIMQFLSLFIGAYTIIRQLQGMSGSGVWLTVVAIVLIGFFTVYAVQLKAKDAVARCQMDLQRQMLDVSGLATSIMSAPQDIQAMNAEPLFSRWYSGAVETLFKKKRSQISTMEKANSLLGFPTQLILACLYGYVVYSVTTGKPGINPGSIVALSYVVPQLMEPFRTFAALGLTATSSWPAVELVTRLSEQPSRISDLPGAVDVDRVEPTLEARHVTFQYQPGGPKIFDNASFEVPGGKITGLVARFGQGKTTFFRLALRLYDPQEGEILVGGRATTSLTLRSLRQQISMLSQNPALFHLTVRENFQVAKPDVTDDEIRRVAEQTDLWPILVKSFGPSPLEQPFAAGAALSGGQRRKFSLACSLLRDSPFLFLDEPSTGLSADDLQDLISTIRTACAGKTVVVIDHILPAFIARLCEHVLVLENGCIVEFGPPEQLLAHAGIFRELYDAQLPQSKSALETSTD